MLTGSVDGEPSDDNCSSFYADWEALTIPGAAELAAAVYAYLGVETWVVALPGANITGYIELAGSGGTPGVCDITNDVGQLSSKLQEIVQQSAPCEFLLPPDADALTLLEGDATLTWPTNEMTIPFVPALQACGQTGGWTWDDPVQPFKVVLCPETCLAIEGPAPSPVTLQLFLGCDPAD